MKNYLHILITALIFLLSSTALAASPDISAPSSSISGIGWNSVSSAYANGGGAAYTTAATTTTTYAQFYGYSNTIPSGSTIDGIRLRVDSWHDGFCNKKNQTFSLTWNSGSSWTSTQAITPNTSETTKYAGTSTYLWGRSWTDTEVNNTTAWRLRVNCANGTCFGANSHYFDYIEREVYYTEPASGPHVSILSTWTPMLAIGALTVEMRKKVDRSRARIVEISK